MYVLCGCVFVYFYGVFMMITLSVVNVVVEFCFFGFFFCECNGDHIVLHLFPSLLACDLSVTSSS